MTALVFLITGMILGNGFEHAITLKSLDKPTLVDTKTFTIISRGEKVFKRNLHIIAEFYSDSTLVASEASDPSDRVTVSLKKPLHKVNYTHNGVKMRLQGYTIPGAVFYLNQDSTAVCIFPFPDPIWWDNERSQNELKEIFIP